MKSDLKSVAGTSANVTSSGSIDEIVSALRTLRLKSLEIRQRKGDLSL